MTPDARRALLWLVLWLAVVAVAGIVARACWWPR